MEARRHTQFRALLSCGKEWFSPGQDLMDHINALRKQVRANPITIDDPSQRVA